MARYFGTWHDEYSMKSIVCLPNDNRIYQTNNIGLSDQHFNETGSVCDVESANEAKWDSKPNGQDMMAEGSIVWCRGKEIERKG